MGWFQYSSLCDPYDIGFWTDPECIVALSSIHHAIDLFTAELSFPAMKQVLLVNVD